MPTRHGESGDPGRWVPRVVRITVIGIVIGAGVQVRAQEATAQPLPRALPLEPAAALKSFVLKDGFELQLVAAEPLVTDPVAGAFDEHGRLFVVEMNDYPYTDKSTDKPNQERLSDLPIGKVRLLVDADDDGLFDSGTVFAGDLSWPTGIAVFDGGVFVAATPDVWYLKDTDNDGVADVRRRVFSGFRKFNVQAVVNNLIHGLDHRIYGAGGSNGGAIRNPDDPNQPVVMMTRHDFRFDPRHPEFELLSGSARFGNTFDDWGRRFICNIRNPIQHVLLPMSYLAGNPLLPVGSPLHDVAMSGDQIQVFRASPPEPWRVVNADRLTAQGDPRMPRSEKQASGFMTSACAVTVYRGDAYPEEFRHQVFIAEPSGNLVHRQRLLPDGVTFRSERMDDQSEFLASTDNWFRPVNFVPAPDGTLYLLDMYRETIEHPWSMPDDLKAMLDLENGRDRGRIYRIAPAGFVRRPTPDPGRCSTEELVDLLEHANVWHRETAHRLLFERQDPAAVPLLRRLRDRTTVAQARLHVLWSLEGLGDLQAGDLESALQDSSPRVREHGVRLTEERIVAGDAASLLSLLGNLVEDDDPGVRLQLAFTLGGIKRPECSDWLATIARRDAADPWIPLAVLSASPDLAAGLLKSLLSDQSFATNAGNLPLLRQLVQVTGARNQPEELLSTGEQLAAWPEQSGDGQLTLILALDDGLRRKGSRVDLAWANSSIAITMLQRHRDTSRQVLINPEADISDRIAALRVLACGEPVDLQENVLPLLNPGVPQELQVAILRTLAATHTDSLAGCLLQRISGATPSVRYEIIEALAAHPQRVPALLEAVKSGQIPAAAITPIRRTLLLNQSDASLKALATELLGADRTTPRHQVVEEYRTVLNAAGDIARGSLVYKRDCATCHRLNDQGFDVGPNLGSIRHRRPEEILTAILDPNREIGPDFLQYAVALTDGRVMTGMVTSETTVSLTLKRAENQQDLVLRQNISEISATGQSLMPEGLEKKITPAEMADLLAYLRGH